MSKFCRKSKWNELASAMTITVMVSETCRSLGDAMRDLDGKAVIRSDFILVSGVMVGNLNFLPILEHHRFETVTDVCHVISIA